MREHSSMLLNVSGNVAIHVSMELFDQRMSMLTRFLVSLFAQYREGIVDLLFYKEGCLRGTHELYGPCVDKDSPLFEVRMCSCFGSQGSLVHRVGPFYILYMLYDVHVDVSAPDVRQIQGTCTEFGLTNPGGARHGWGTGPCH
eukprot:1159466-Pelagomonas_calceolata.AAC.3